MTDDNEYQDDGQALRYLSMASGVIERELEQRYREVIGEESYDRIYSEIRERKGNIVDLAEELMTAAGVRRRAPSPRKAVDEMSDEEVSQAYADGDIDASTFVNTDYGKRRRAAGKLKY